MSVHARALLALAALALVAVPACSGPSPERSSGAPPPTRSEEPAPGDEPSAPPAEPVAWPPGLPAADPVTCPPATVEVRTAEELQAALDDARPGDVIALADGTYEGEFTASAQGTEEEPVWLCGSADAVLQGPGTDDGFVLHLQGVAHWRLVGFTVREGKKGVMADGTTSSVLQDLTVTEIGDEAVHLRTGSTDNVVRGLTISDTGQRREKFGEGVYVGTAESNWCDLSDCGPDRSDRNAVVANTITGTTAEAVDVKEGTTGGLVAGNSFDGAGMEGDADSWVDVKGNGWLVQDNRGTTAETSGFEVNEAVEGWGRDNTFDANRADVRGSGYGIELRVPDNRVTCANTATRAEEGLTNTDCR